MGMKVFVGGLGWNTSEIQLQEAFEKFGTIQELRIVTHKITGKSRGFGFVTFADETSAKAAVEKMDGSSLDNRPIRVSIAEERQDRPEEDGSSQESTNEDRKVFLGALDWKTDDNTLRRAFEEFGSIEGIRIVTDRYTGKSKGFGFITFSSPVEAKVAIEKMDGIRIDGKAIHVHKAKPSSKKRGPRVSSKEGF